MENEIRYYLKQTKEMMHDENATFVPSYLITAIKLPTGAIELAINTNDIESKIDYILTAYDEDMHLKSNNDIVMQNIMIV